MCGRWSRRVTAASRRGGRARCPCLEGRGDKCQSVSCLMLCDAIWLTSVAELAVLFHGERGQGRRKRAVKRRSFRVNSGTNSVYRDDIETLNVLGERQVCRPLEVKQGIIDGVAGEPEKDGVPRRYSYDQLRLGLAEQERLRPLGMNAGATLSYRNQRVRVCRLS